MIRRILLSGILAGLVLPVFQAEAVIKAAPSLKVYLDSSTFIFSAKVEKLYPEKPALVLAAAEDFKGKNPHRRLPITVKLDPKAENENYIPPLMKRLGENQDVILFVNQRGELAIVYAFTNGSWFHMVGRKSDGEKVAWSLVSGEPYLRRSFKGTTAEMRQLVVDYLAGKRKAPEADEKEAPGFGPELKSAEPPAKKSARNGAFTPHQSGPLFGVIPTLGIGGPLAILALLFPTVFGGVLVLFRQWMAFITVLSVNSTLYLLYLWQGFHLRGTWLGSEAGLWFVMTLIALAGTIWAWSRQVYNLSLGAGAVETPRRAETTVLWTLSILCGGFALFLAIFSSHWDISDYLLFVFAFGIIVGTVVHMMRGWFFALAMNPGRSMEGVILSSVLLGHLAIAAARWSSGGDVAGAAEAGDIPSARVAELVGLRWHFQAQDSGLFVSSPLIDGDRVYAAAANPTFKVGTLYCLDRISGRKIWEFIGNGHLKQMISSPCLADGRLYIGEGFHDDPDCRLWCIDAATGHELWHFQTKGQTESSPAVAAGKVYFGAGNEGLYCLDAGTGKELWRFPGRDYQGRLLRFGGGPCVLGDRVFAATGVDRNKTSTDAGETALFCLDAHTGKLFWKKETRHPAWGAPVVSKGQVFLGTGNGDIFDDAKDPSLGALYCLDAKTGDELWQRPFVNGVIDRPAVDESCVYVSCRNGYVYCLDRTDGNKRWKTFLESPVVAAPALAQWCGHTDSVFAIATKGKVCCLDPDFGAIHWTYNLTDQKPHLSAAPKVVVNRTAEGDRRQIYFGAAVGHIVSGQAVLYCLEDRLKDR
jgi:outer membrane protein assembly factor BamB